MTRFVRNTAYSTLAGLCYSVGAFATSIIVARSLGVGGAGIVAFALWIMAITVAVTDLGIYAVLTRFLPELTHDGHSRQADALIFALFRPFWMAAVGGFLIYAVLTALPGSQATTRSVFGDYGEPVLWFLIGAVCLAQSLATFMQGVWRGLQEFDKAAKVVLLSVSIQLLGVTVGSIFAGVLGAIAGVLAGQVVAAAFCFTLPRNGSSISHDLRRRALRHAAYSWAGSLASSIVWSRVELAFLNGYFGTDQVGLFSVGLTLATMAIQGPMLLTGGLLAHLSESYGKKNFQALRDAGASGTRMLAFVVLPMCFGTAGILPQLLPLIYGKAFGAAVPAATVLVASAALGACAVVATNIVIVYERTDIIALNGLLGIILTILVGLFVIPHFGLVGAAWGRTAVQLVLVFIGLWFVERRLHCPFPWKDLARLAAAALACGGAARVVVVLMPSLPGLAAAIVIGAVVYFGSVFFLQAIPKEDVDRFRLLLSSLVDRFRLTIDRGWSGRGAG